MTEISGQRLDEIANKIAKMRRLEANPGTPEEAAAATAIIQKLMEQHQISEAIIDIAADRPIAGYGHELHDFGKLEAWRTQIIMAVAMANHCRVVRTHSGALDIIGHRDTVPKVIDLSEWLILEITNMSVRGWKETPKYSDNTTKGKWQKAYCIGAAVTVGNRITEEARKNKREQTAEMGNAIIIINNRVDEVLHKLYPFLRRGRNSSQSAASDAAFRQGQSDAAGMTLEKRRNIGTGRVKIG